MAQDGWTYDQILGHFYTGAELGPSPVGRVRVLVAEAKAGVTVRSSVPFPVHDIFGKTYPLPAGEVTLGPKLRVAVNGTPTDLAGPILFLPGTAPLELDRGLPGSDLRLGDGSEARRGQHPRPRAVPRRVWWRRRCRAPGPTRR